MPSRDVLRLSPLEASSILTDRQREPHTIELEITAAGAVDPDLVRTAVAAAIGRHPMARVQLERSAWWRRSMRWKPLEDRPDPVVVHQHGWDASSSPASELVSAYDGVPFQVHLHSTPTASRLLLAVNHAAFDGLGAVRLLRSIAAASSGQQDPEPAVDALGARWEIAPQEGSEAAPTVAGASESKAVSHLAEHGESDRPGTWIVHRRIDAVRPPAGVTVNDLLQAELHLALARWIDDDADLVRVLMPVNVRPPAWSTDVVGNFAWLGSVDSRRADRADRPRLTDVIGQQTAAIRSLPRPSKILELIGQGLVPLAAARAAFLVGARVGRRTIATATLSNLGRVPALPPLAGVPVTEMWFSAPCRVPRGLALGVTGYDGHLHLSVRARRSTLTLADTERFADELAQTLNDQSTSLAQAG